MYSKKAIGAVALALMFIAGIASAQTGTGTGTSATDDTTYQTEIQGSATGTGTGSSAVGGESATSGDPGVPNTGVGGTAVATSIMLATTSMIATGGLYLLRRRIV